MNHDNLEQTTIIEPQNSDMDHKREENIFMNDKYSTELRTLFLIRLLQGNMKDTNAIRLQMQQLNLPFEGYHHVICVISAVNDMFPVTADATLCFVKEQISLFANAHGMFTTCCMDQLGHLVVVLSSQNRHEALIKLENSLPKIIEASYEKAETEVYYGIGPVIDQIVLVPESYSYAVAILERNKLTPDENGTQAYKSKYSLNDRIQDQLIQLFRERNMGAIAETVHKHVEKIKLNHTGRQVLIERFAVLYLQNITNECMRLGITLERFESYIPAVVCLMQLDGMGSISAILQLTEQILKYINVHRTREGNHLLNMAKEFILENMGNERLDLAAVSDHVGLSRVYFCKLFHQMEGVSFGVYLKNLRIEKAKQLLLTTNMKVFEISNTVGFSHAKYFGHVFKEVVGQTPVEFQKGTRND